MAGIAKIGGKPAHLNTLLSLRKVLLLSLFIPSAACANHYFAGEAAIKVVLESKDDDARWKAVRRLGELKYKPAIPLLIKSLGDPSHFVRANTARALCDMKATEAREALVSLLSRETDGGVIQQTTLGILQFGASESLPSLRQLANHEDIQTQIWVLETIGHFGQNEDVTCIASYLESPQASVQTFSAEILGRMTHQVFGVIHNGPSGTQHVGVAKFWWAKHHQDYPGCNWGLTKRQRETTNGVSDADNKSLPR